MTTTELTGTWVEIGPVADVPPLGSRVFRLPNVHIAIIRAEEDKIFAIENKCPHKNGPLSEGIVHGCRVTCPLHNWVIELETGEAVAPDEGKVATWPVRVDNGNIFVQVKDAE
ncbi:MAG: nitrite reductase small subunit NirD [Methyloligellaceae bacterium]